MYKCKHFGCTYMLTYNQVLFNECCPDHQKYRRPEPKYKPMTLLDAIQFTLPNQLTFAQEGNQLKLTIKKEDKEYSQMLPLADHCYEEKLVDCIKFMNEKLK